MRRPSGGQLLAVALVVMTLVQPFAGVAGAQSEFTGEVSIFADSATDGSTSYYDLAEPSGVENYSVQLTGEETSETESSSATSLGSGETLSLHASGSETPRNETVTFTGVEQTRGAYWSGTGVTGGSTDSIEVTGNQPSTNTAVTFTGGIAEGTWKRQSYTNVTDGHSGTLSIDGVGSSASSVADPTINVTGSTNTAWDNESYSSVGDGFTTTVQSGGTHTPTDERVLITGKTTSNTNSIGGSTAGSTTVSLDTGGTEQPTGDLTLSPSANEPRKYPVDKRMLSSSTEQGPIGVLINSPPNEIQRLKFEEYSAGSYGNADNSPVTVDIYISKGDDRGSPTTGTLVANDVTYGKSATNTVVTLNIQNFDASGASQVTVGFDLVSYGTETTDAGFNDYSNNYVELQQPTTSVHVSDESGTTTHSISNGGSKTVSLDLATTTSSIGLAGNYGSLNYDGSYTTTTATTDPSVTVGGQTLSQSGTLSDGATISKSLDLATGSNTLSASASSGSQFDVTVEQQEVSKTVDPTVSLNGNAKTISGTLADGQTETVSFANADVLTGTNNLSLSLSSVGADAPTPRASYEASIKDVPGTKNPAVDIGNDGTIDAQYEGVLGPGEAKTVTLPSLDPGTQVLGFGGSNATYEWRIETTEHAITENPRLDVDGDGTADAAVPGRLQPGEVATATTDIPLGRHAPSVSTDSWSETGVTVQYTEVTHSQNPSVLVNGREFAHEGTLGPNETTALDVSRDALTSGENEVVVRVGQSLSADAPTSRVTVDYYHTASVIHESRLNATAWTEERWVNHTFIDNRTDATLRVDMHDSVVSIKQVELATSPGNYSRVLESNYEYDNGSLHVSLGDVQANETASVHVQAQRINVRSGAVDVTDPTTPGDALNTEITVTNRTSGFAIGTDSERVLHATQESWSNPSESARITADGRQWLRLPNAETGSSTRISYTPLEVRMGRGDVAVSIEDLSENQFSVSPGQTTGDTVRFVWLDTVQDQTYSLYSMTHQDVQDAAKSGSTGVVLVNDDDSETFDIKSADEEETSIGPGFQDFEIVLVIGVIAVAFALLYYVMHRWGSGLSSTRDWAIIGILTVIVSGLGIETVSPGTITQLLNQPIVSVMGAVLVGLTVIYFVSQYIPGGRRLRLAFIGVGVVLITAISAEAISPGFIGDLAPALDPVVRLGGIATVAIISYAAYRYLSGGDSGRSDGSGSSETATARVVIDDESRGD